MNVEENKGLADLWIFGICALFICFLVNWLQQAKAATMWISLAPFAVGILAFTFQLSINKRPLIELYSKGYPYRRLKPYGVISAFLLFEFVLVWGLHTRQIIPLNEDLFLIIVILIGTIVYYHAFVRMKVSLRFLFLAILIPTLATGAALGLGSFFKILKFVVPASEIGRIVFFNTTYWILFNLFFQTVCEEPAFRGYLMQRLLGKGEAFAILISSLIFALWRVCFVLFSGMDYLGILLVLSGNFIMGAIFALLFIKGRNLMVAILSHAILDGLANSVFASSTNPGIREYIEFLAPGAKVQLMGFWFGCLFVGLILLTIIPRKKI